MNRSSLGAPPPSRRPGRLRHRILTGECLVSVFALIVGLVVATMVTTAPSASVAPGNPGVPGAPRVLFTEDFDNAPNNSNVLLTNYVGESGTTYTGDPFWVSRNNCNGFIIDHGSPRVAGDCNGAQTDTFGEQAYDSLTAIPRAIGLFNGLDSGAANLNGAASSYTSGSTTDNEVQFETQSPIQLPAANRFVTFSVDAGAENCFATHPELRFYLKNDAGAEFPVSDTAIDPCTDSRARTIQSVTQQGRAFDVNVGRFVADGNRLLTGTTLGIVMRNENGFGGGNDGAYDNIRVLDVTPQLDKSFSPQRVPVNGVSTLTLTVTNTSELGAKNGWAFTDNLPDGLVVADDPNLGGTCQATRTATPGTGTVEITDGVLAEGAQSCTVTVDVTSKSPTGSEASPVTYRNCAANFSDVVGMDLPNCASVEFYSEAKLQIEKTSDATSGTRVGDTVTYTIRATNVGDADYTNADPAVVGDDLTGVIDDATYNEDATASVGSRPTYDEPRLRWSGPLKVDDSVTITYSVTLTGAGDRAVENVAWESCRASDPDCNPDPPQECVDNVDPATGRACDETTTLLPKLVVEKSADTTELPTNGGTVTYTVVATNEGPGDYTQSKPAYVTDDLTNVLDDGTLDEGSIAADRTPAPTYSEPRISWKGALTAGQSVTLTYQVTYDATKDGDHDLANVAFGSDTPPPSTTPACNPAVNGVDPATGLPCDRVTVPGADLEVTKSVDPQKGSTVKAGQELTYTLTFDNDGKAAADVDYTDYLAKVLDDADVTSGPTAEDGSDLTVSPIADQTFDVDGTVAPGDTVTVTYTVTVKPDGERGDDQLGNFLAQGDDQPPAECAADDPLCTNNPVGQVEHRKSVSPSTGTTVQPGETLTYTLRQGAVVVRRPGATRHAARGADGGGRPAPAVRPAPAHRGRGADACDGGARVESVPAEPLRDGGRPAAAPGGAREPESGHRGGRGAGARDTREGPRRPAPPPGGGCAAVRSGRGERTRPAGGARRHRADRDGERLRDGAQRRPRRPPRAAGRPAAGVPGRPPPVELAPGRGRSVGRPHPAGAGGPAAVRPSRVGRGGRPSAVGVGQHREEAAGLVVREARRP
ncbi:MAG: hypothetical protein NTV28_08510 [Propionibacteriales bacterium]|nr:hypothetical protein [Propionibacteriales bacterium]